MTSKVKTGDKLGVKAEIHPAKKDNSKSPDTKSPYGKKEAVTKSPKANSNAKVMDEESSCCAYSEEPSEFEVTWNMYRSLVRDTR